VDVARKTSPKLIRDFRDVAKKVFIGRAEKCTPAGGSRAWNENR
jgi:hypothetical protein